MLVDNCYWLNYNAAQQLQQILILARPLHLHLYLDQDFFVLPNNFCVSGYHNSNLKPVFF